jgi:uncharacterized protein YciI
MMRNVLGAVICALLVAACVTASTPKETPMPSPAKSQEAPPETVFAVRFHPGLKWVAGAAAFDQPEIMKHVANLKAWDAAGKLYLGGPYLDSSGGMAVLRVASMDEAKGLAESDPCVLSGLMTTEVHPWLLAFAPH